MIGGVVIEIPKDVIRQELLSSKAVTPAHWRSHGPYRAAYDLRPLGIAGALHVEHRRSGHHRLEVIGCDRLSLAEITNTVEQIVSSDVADLRLQRLDLTADVPNMDMDCVREHIFVKHKRTSHGYEKIRFETGTRQLQSLYFGRKRDFIRIYDKDAQMCEQHAQPSRFSAPEPGSLIRFERQLLATSAFAKTFGDLKKSGQWRPFDQVYFPDLLPTSDEAPLRTKIVRAGVQAIIAEKGFYEARAYFNRESRGNAARILKGHMAPRNYAEAPNLNLIFQQSARRQLNEESIAN